MEKTEICKNLIKIANQFDKQGDYELANDLTVIAENIANNERVALNLGRLLGKQNLFGLAANALKKRMSPLQRAQALKNPQLIQEATTLKQQVDAFNQKLDAAEKGQTPTPPVTTPPGTIPPGTTPASNPQVTPQTGQANIKPFLTNNNLAKIPEIQQNPNNPYFK